MTTSQRVKEKAIELGFDLVGIAPAKQATTAHRYLDWLAAGHHAELGWMARDPNRRVNPQSVLEGARSVVALGLTYFVENPPAEVWDDPSRGRFARYAWGPDYHDVMTPMLEALAAFIQTELPGARARYYVDTGPVLERSFAADAGLGFVGKNTLLISPGYGSYVFLAEILVDHVLDYDETPVDPTAISFQSDSGHTKQATCGSCTRCQTACPTHAFPAEYVLDSRLCISYLTIELKGAIPEPLRPKLGNWVYGCDACQSVCPWVHRYSRPTEKRFLSYDPDTSAPSLLALMQLDEEGFRQRFKGTPMRRTKRRGLLRNVAVALGNWGDAAAAPVLESALADPEPLIREHATWALARLRT